ncbi:hypothetical protein KM043_010829 [Ampulex compressa]|nr:hypothetical protein KM043_010829 [Ampulex compressa]
MPERWGSIARNLADNDMPQRSVRRAGKGRAWRESEAGNDRRRMARSSIWKVSLWFQGTPVRKILQKSSVEHMKGGGRCQRRSGVGRRLGRKERERERYRSRGDEVRDGERNRRDRVRNRERRHRNRVTNGDGDRDRERSHRKEIETDVGIKKEVTEIG